MNEAINATQKEDYVYHILPLKYFLQILDNRCLHFPRVSSWEDPYELFMFKQNFIDCKEHSLNAMYQAEHIFGQCWTAQRDSDALWRIYSPDRMSVRIKTTKKKIESFVKQNQGSGLLLRSEMVSYQTQSQIETWVKSLAPSNLMSIPFVDSLFIKRNSFSHEKELRIIIWEADFDEQGTQKSCHKFIELPINPTELILEVNLDPRLSQEEVSLLKPALALRCNFCRVSQSRLYKIKPNTIMLI